MLGAFTVLSVTGLLSYFVDYNRGLATVHTIFGILFTVTGLLHILNNIKPLRNYSKRGAVFFMLGLVGVIAFFSYSELPIAKSFMDFGARSKANLGNSENDNTYSKITMGLGKEHQLSLDIKRAKHFWHPQIAIWTEDTTGVYKETLFVTKATAKGFFAGGRSKENFKELDNVSSMDVDSYRRVNALPVWSHKRGVKYDDGLFAPTYEDPMPDGLSGATPLDNFIFETSVDYQEPFVVKFEINVAFDDNEYYSEFDFADDATFHNGTGQLGQPSLIYASKVNSGSMKTPKIMKLQGHGHHSSQDGSIYEDVSKLTTALEIIEYIVLGFETTKT